MPPWTRPGEPPWAAVKVHRAVTSTGRGGRPGRRLGRPVHPLDGQGLRVEATGGGLHQALDPAVGVADEHQRFVLAAGPQRAGRRLHLGGDRGPTWPGRRRSSPLPRPARAPRRPERTLPGSACRRRAGGHRAPRRGARPRPAGPPRRAAGALSPPWRRPYRPGTTRTRRAVGSVAAGSATEGGREGPLGDDHRGDRDHHAGTAATGSSRPSTG